MTNPLPEKKSLTFLPAACFFAFPLLILLSGCAGTRGAGDTFKIKKSVIGASVWETPITSYSMGKGDDVILMMASIHGDETAGTPLCFQFMDYLQAHPEMLDGKTVVFLPVTNPDGCSIRTRYNANGVDLNRNFPTENRINNSRFGLQALSEPEAQAIVKLIDRSRPDRILSFHEPYNCIDFDGPGEDLAHYLSGYCDLEVKKIGARHGSLGSYAGERLGIPIITVEFSGEAASTPEEEMWTQYKALLIAAIQYPGGLYMEASAAGTRSEDHRQPF